MLISVKFQYRAKFGVAPMWNLVVFVSSKHLCFSHPTYFVNDLKVDVRKDFTKKGHNFSEDGFR